MNATLTPPRLAVAVNPSTVALAHQWHHDLTTIVEWGLYVDEEYGMTPQERDLWRVLVIMRDTLGDLHSPDPRDAAHSSAENRPPS